MTPGRASAAFRPNFPSSDAKALKGTSGRKKVKLTWKSVKNAKKKRAITDLNAPNGSRDIPFQSQEFEHYGRAML